MTRRQLIATGLGVTAGASGLAAAKGLAQRYGLIPPDHAGIYGAGETLNYATHKLLTNHSLAREFRRDQISNPPFANGEPPKDEAYVHLQAGGFADWRLSIDGMVSRPGWVPVGYLSVLSSRRPNFLASARVEVCSGLMNSACRSTICPSAK